MEHCVGHEFGDEERGYLDGLFGAGSRQLLACDLTRARRAPRLRRQVEGGHGARDATERVWRRCSRLVCEGDGGFRGMRPEREALLEIELRSLGIGVHESNREVL